jgi:hypothetical protein
MMKLIAQYRLTFSSASVVATAHCNACEPVFYWQEHILRAIVAPVARCCAKRR